MRCATSGSTGSHSLASTPCASACAAWPGAEKRSGSARSLILNKKRVNRSSIPGHVSQGSCDGLSGVPDLPWSQRGSQHHWYVGSLGKMMQDFTWLSFRHVCVLNLDEPMEFAERFHRDHAQVEPEDVLEGFMSTISLLWGGRLYRQGGEEIHKASVRHISPIFVLLLVLPAQFGTQSPFSKPGFCIDDHVAGLGDDSTGRSTPNDQERFEP